MFFHESEVIAREHPDLLRVIEGVDKRLSAVCSRSPLRPGDFACAAGAAKGQVESTFELLAKQGVLSTEDMVECERCQNFMSAAVFEQAIRDEDDLECTGCGSVLHRRSTRALVYRLTAEAILRTKANAKPLEVQLSELFGPGLGDEPLSERAQYAIVAMLNLGAVDSDSRKSAHDIAIEALGPLSDENDLKAAMVELKARLLVMSKRGRNGGCWLTAAGRSRAEKLRRRTGNSAPI